MRKAWVAGAFFCLACGSGEPAPEAPETAEASGAEQAAEATEPAAEEAAEASESTAEAAPATPPSCVAKEGAEPKLVEGEDEASELPESEIDTIFDVGGLTVQVPACSPEASTEVITVRWEHEHRPISSHVDPKFSRHGHTIVVDSAFEAPEGRSIVVGIHSGRKLSKGGKRFVLAVEYSGECTGRYKRDKLEWGDCAHWKIFDTHYDEKSKEMVGEIHSTGGYRLQFGWMPK